MTVTLNFEDFPNLASELENSKPGATVTANVVMNLNSTDEGSATPVSYTHLTLPTTPYV